MVNQSRKIIFKWAYECSLNGPIRIKFDQWKFVIFSLRAKLASQLLQFLPTTALFHF